MEARAVGMAHVTQRLFEHLDDERKEYLQGIADGINRYIEAVKAEELPGPSELDLATVLLQVESPADLMEPFDVLDVCAMAVSVMYEINYEGDDVGRTAKAWQLEGSFEGQEKAELRKAGFLEMWFDERPIFPGTNTTAGFGLDTAEPASKPGAVEEQSWAPAFRPTNQAMLERLAAKLDAWNERFGRDRDKGFGSNTWAVHKDKTPDGWSLVAGDGHLQLSVPALFWRVGLDTQTFGGDEGYRQIGMFLTGMTVMSVGTNGHVGYSGVNPVADITDWYREELQLDENGVPAASFFQGEWKGLIATEETFVIADVVALGSVGRTEVHKRWTTFDGRWIRDIEGRSASPDEALADGETLINLAGNWIVPGDQDGDGVVTAISFDYAGFDATQWLRGNDEMGFAKNVTELREAMKRTVGSALYIAGNDGDGGIMFSAYQGFPCRGYLERDDEGRYTPGSDPKMLLDGTVYGAFELPTTDGLPDEAAGADDPYRCIIPFDEVPQAENPAAGYVFNANNDPSGATDDGKLWTAKWHIGGPWSSVRASTIDGDLAACSADQSCTLETMKAMQGNHTSRMGQLFLPHLLAAIDRARTLSETDGDLGVDDARLVAIFDGAKDKIEAAEARLKAWADDGYDTPGGVVTFYHPEVTEQELKDAAATMIYNAFQPRFVNLVWNDESMPGWRHSGDRARFRGLRDFLAGRGADNPGDSASWDPETNEAVWFDVRGTEDVERSDELLLAALVDGLTWLEGDFETDDMSRWLWGLRHQAKFESLIGDFLPPDSSFSAITDIFATRARA